jgi:ketosteroid isomerase-like protein
MAKEDVEIVREALEILLRRGFDAALPFFDPDVTWEAAKDEPDAGTYRGHQGVRTFIGKWLELFDRLHFEPQAFIAAGDAVVVPYRLRARARSTGIEITGEETWVIQVQRGQIVGVQEYREKDDALEAVGLSDQA